MNVSIAHTNFSGGEIDQEMQYKVDQARRAVSVAKAYNMYVQKNGALSTKPGTMAMAQAKYADKKCRIIPFTFSSDQAYILEVGENYIRYHTTSGTITDEAGEIYETATPYAEAVLPRIRSQQSADVMYIVDGEQRQKTLIRYDHAQWEIKDYISKKGPYMPWNTDQSISMILIHDNGAYKLSCSSDYFDAKNIDSLFKIRQHISSQSIKKTFSATGGTSDPIICKDQWRLRTSGNWTGTVFVEKSKNLISWQRIGGFTNDSDGNNTNTYGDSGEDGLTWVRLYYGQASSGSVTASLSVDGFTEEIHCKVIDYIDAKTVSVVPDTDIEQFYKLLQNVVVEYANIMPVMTSNTTPRGKVSGLGGGWVGSTGYQNSSLLYYGADGNQNTGWTPLSASPSGSAASFWQYEFNVPSVINEVEISIYASQLADYYTLTIYDGVNSVSYGRGAWNSVTSRLLWKLSNKKANYIRIDFSGAYTYKAGFAEIRVNGIAQTAVAAGTTEWAEGAWSEKNGYPAQITTHEERIAFASTKMNPGGVWLGETGALDSFMRNSPLLATDGISINVWGRNKTSVVNVNGLLSLEDLIIFTNDGIFRLYSSGVLAPETSRLRPAGADGSNGVAPLPAGSGALFGQTLGTQLKSYGYSLENDNFKAFDKSKWAAHFLKRRKIVSMAYQREPDSIIWIVCDDGKLLSFTYIEDEGIEGWALHETDGEYEDVCTIPGDGYDEPWFVVKRNGKRIIERGVKLRASEDIKEQIQVDCAMTYRAGEGEDKVDVILGLGHLEGKMVSGLADGFKITPRMVVNGQITLDRPASIVHVGLPYKCYAKGLPANWQAQDGPTIGRKMRSVSAKVMLAGTCGGFIGADERENFLQRIPLGTKNGNNFLESGQYDTPLDSDWGDATFYFEQSEPYPATLTTVILDVEYGG
ncbi:hypothetical protein Dip510_000828 [Elusimicrobium posterum]|uniref:hypothetical protein n=1 Tax=Elusimicrobium posterum TaxID=3116653 RepID=UPI003C7126EA